MRFDWYQATVSEHPRKLMDSMAARLGAHEIVEGRGRHNYLASYRINDSAGNRLAEVLAGGNNGANPNIMASGEITPAFVSALREGWPVHIVTRFDAAEDFEGVGVYERLQAQCKDIVATCRVSGRAIVPEDVREGRTYYLGAPSSDVRVRLYDKSAELRRKLPPEKQAAIPDNVTRLETQVRPRGNTRRFACQLQPEMIWGCAGWSTQLYEAVFGMELQRIEMQAGRESDHERAYRFMLQQYGKVLQRLHSDAGSWQAVGLQIGEDLRKLASLKR